ncbi:uncharacterized protein TNCV_2050751 [Trichonephila clavipes]|nr:uncharacterized protein TNCV_2050751 [Trichonephila clavipes]
MGAPIPNFLQPGTFVWIEEDTLTPSEGGNCFWMAADEAAVCTLAFLTMWRFSLRQICRGHPEPCLRVNEISRIDWSQNLLTTQSEQPKRRATYLGDLSGSIMPKILPLSNFDSSSYCLRKWRNDMSTSALSL